MATKEGIFGEPASAASVAGLIKWSHRLDLSDKKVVCVVTGNGLKDPDTAMRGTQPFLEMPPELGKMEKALGWC
jgi:threonine synthase